MTQYQNVTIDPTVTNGSQLASNINSWREATLSLHSGVARPAYATAGTMWISTASTPWKLYVFDGVNDAPLGEIDPAGHAFVSAGGTDFTNELMTAADPAAARDKLGAQKKIGYEPVDKAGDTTTGTIESRMVLGDPEASVRSIGNRVVLEGRGDVDGDNYRGWLEVEEEVGVTTRMKIVLIGDDGRKEFLFDQSGSLETPGPLVLPAAPTADLHAATKQYVDGLVESRNGSATAGHLVMPGGTIIQWAIGAEDTGSREGQQTITWHTTFPNAVLSAHVSTMIPSASASNDFWYQIVGYPGATGGTVQRQTHGSSGTTRPFVFAIGY